MENEIKINGQSLSSMGVTLERNGYAALLTPAPIKEVIQNDDPLKNGVQVLPSSPLLQNERDVTLTFLVQGTSQLDFLDNYAAFMEILRSGIINLQVPDLKACFRLLYSSATQFENYRLNACKLAVKFRQPDPSNRDL